jgi:hypothetical protein
MTKFNLAVILAAIPAVSLGTAPAHALQTLTFMQRGGDNSTACGASNLPCGSFQAAHNVTTDGGRVIIIDSGDFGFATISKSITFSGGQAYALATNGGFLINSSVKVVLQNLIFDGSGTSGSGITALGGASLLVDGCVVQNYGIGVRFIPSAAGKLVVQNSTVTDNGYSSSGGGIIVNPSGSGSARVVIERTSVLNNVFGIVADGSQSTAGINMTINESLSGGNAQDGIIATTPSGGAPIGIYVKNTRSSNNNFGIRSIGASATIRVDGSSVIGNVTGLSFSNGGKLQTFGNNASQANASNGSFSGPVPLQ